jgi:hypothetical protein
MLECTIRNFLERAPFNRESLILLAIANIAGLGILLVYPKYALVAPAVIFGWTQISSG